MCSTALVGCLQAQPADLRDVTGDGVGESLVASLGFDEQSPAVGTVTVRDGMTGDALFQLSGVSPNDGFGFAACFLPDVSGDGRPEIAVSAPRRLFGSASLGCVMVYSGDTGEFMYEVGGENGDRFGFGIAEEPTPTPFGRQLLIVEGMAIDLSGRPVHRRHHFDAETGAVLYRETIPIPGIDPIIIQEQTVWGDLDSDLDSDVMDFGTLVSAVASGAELQEGDLNGDESVNTTDVSVLADALGNGGTAAAAPTPMPIGSLQGASWDLLTAELLDWFVLYPEDPISAALGGSAKTGSPIPNWWFDGRFRAEHDVLVNGWWLTDTSPCISPDGASYRQQPATATTGQCPCNGEVDIEEARSHDVIIRFEEIFEVCATKQGDCGSLEWKFAAPAPLGFDWEPGGDCRSITYSGSVIAPSLVGRPVQVYVRCADCPDAIDAITYYPTECGVTVGSRDSMPFRVAPGQGTTREFVATGFPPGGTYSWSWDDPSGVIVGSGAVMNGNSILLPLRYPTLGAYTGPTALAYLRVQYSHSPPGSDAVSTCEAFMPILLELDSDGDTIPDGREDNGGEGPGCSDPFDTDSDDDGLSDPIEVALGLDPCDTDSDGDGLQDGCEYGTSTDPTIPDFDPGLDSDHDGLTDFRETNPCIGHGTSPNDSDTDNDGILDGCEVEHGTDPNSNLSPSAIIDSDGDGAPDLLETCARTSAHDPDSDDDGILDGIEIAYMACSDPSNPDTDGDGLLDGDEVNGRGTDQCHADTDRDGLTDGFEAQYDGTLRYIGVGEDLQPGNSALDLDPLSADSDNDDIPDGDEDEDLDGLTNREEQARGSNPAVSDTDGDGMTDGDEVGGGSDPGDAYSLATQPYNHWFTTVTLRVHSNGGNGARYLRVTGGGRSYTSAISDYGSTSTNAVELELVLRRGEVYKVWVPYSGSEPGFWNDSCDHDLNYCASVAVDPESTAPIIIEDENGVLGCFDDRICYDRHDCDPSFGKHATLYLPIVDLDIDSDNTSILAAPDRDLSEDLVEDDPNRNGKLIAWNGGDADNDGRADTSDGFDLTNEPHDDQIDSVETTGFTPVLVEVAGLKQLGDGSEYSLIFEYDASVPEAIQTIDYSTQRFELPDGALRLWTKDRGMPRHPGSVCESGDFVPAGEAVAFSDVGLDPSVGGTLTLFVESVRYSDSVGDMLIRARVVGGEGPDLDDAVRCTVPRLVPQARSFASGAVSDSHDPQSVVPTSDPRPHVELSIIDHGSQGPTVDPITGELIIWANWRVCDPLSGVLPPAYALQEVRFFADGHQIDEIVLSGQLQPSSNFPFQQHELDVSGLIELRVPAGTDADGNPRSWGAAAVMVEARTTANALGHVGFERSAVIFRLVESAGLEEPGSFLAVTDDPTDPYDSELYLRSEFDRVQRLSRSPAGVLESLVFTLSPLDTETAQNVTVTMTGLNGPGLTPGDIAVIQPETLQIVQVDPNDPHTHHLVFSPERQHQSLNHFVQLVFISDEAFDTTHIVPENVRRRSFGAETYFEICKGDGSAPLGFGGVKIVTLSEYQALPRAAEEAPLDERPLNEADIRLFYELLATDNLAMLRLQAFDGVGGEIVISDLGLVPFSDVLAPKFEVQVNGQHFRILIDEDCSPPEAVQYLADGLAKASGKSLYWIRTRDWLLDYHGLTYDEVEYREHCDSMRANIAAEIGPIMQAIPMIISVVSEPTDWVITIAEVADGNWTAVAGFLPAVPAQVFQAGKAIKFVLPDGNTWRVTSHQAAVNVSAVMSGPLPMSTAQAAAGLKAAGMTVLQRVQAIKSGRFLWLQPVKKKSSSAYRNALVAHTGNPVPTELGEKSVFCVITRHPDVHHVLLLQHADWFLAHGIDVNEPEFLRWMSKTEHSRLHGRPERINPANPPTLRYNVWWERLQEQEIVRIQAGGDEFSRDEIMEFINQAKFIYGIQVDPVRSDIWMVGPSSQ
jgi:hypothetical protein